VDIKKLLTKGKLKEGLFFSLAELDFYKEIHYPIIGDDEGFVVLLGGFLLGRAVKPSSFGLKLIAEGC
jgi:hypothetical protein